MSKKGEIKGVDHFDIFERGEKEGWLATAGSQKEKKEEKLVIFGIFWGWTRRGEGAIFSEEKGANRRAAAGLELVWRSCFVSF